MEHSLARLPRPAFTSDRLQRLVEIERRHFWFAGRRDLVDRLLADAGILPGSALADIGCGGGYYCQRLSERGYRMTAVDFLPGGLRRLSRDAPAVHTIQGLAQPLAIATSACDAVLALDVLEHLDDDRAALAEFFRILKPNGVLLLTVPALAWLWSYRDVAAGHRRRYRSAQLRELLSGAGFIVERIGFYNFFLLPIAILTRFTGRFTKTARDMEDAPPGPLNAFLRFVTCMEVRCGGSRGSWPVGSSLFAIARRPG